MTREGWLAWQKRRIEVGCLSGYWSREAILGAVEDQLASADLDQAAQGPMLEELRAHLAASWVRARELEATWGRTALDRLDDALRELAKGSHKVVKLVSPQQADDPNAQTWWRHDGDPLEDPARGWPLTLQVEYDGHALHATGRIEWPHTTMRRDEFQPVIDEVTRVLGAFGIAASFDEASAAIVTERIPFQKRLTTVAPKATEVVAPTPTPSVCAICGGRGWVRPPQTTQFAQMCACKRDPLRFEPKTPPMAMAVGQAVTIAVGVFLLARLVKQLPTAFCLAGAVLSAGVFLWRETARVDVLELGATFLVCRSDRRSWRLPFERIARAYVFEDRWVFESKAGERYTFSLVGHDAHRSVILEALHERASVCDLAWTSTLVRGAALGRVV